VIYAQIHLTLPPWVHQVVDPNLVLEDPREQMRFAIQLAALNIDRRSGGPFGAAVFTESGRLVGIGVNRVMPLNCSIAHAEMMALMTSQQRVQRFRLNDDGARYTLATSAQPCCQCYGALFWAGIDRVLIGARAADVHELTGFDEGPLPADWSGELERRGIDPVCDLEREAAREVLASYGAASGRWY